MKEFYKIIIGNATLPQWAASMFLALLVQSAMLLLRAKKRDVNSERTPTEWSWKFFWKDTTPQIVGTVILIFVFIRVLQFWIEPKWLVAVALAVGLSSDQLFYYALIVKDWLGEKFKKKVKET